MRCAAVLLAFTLLIGVGGGAMAQLLPVPDLSPASSTTKPEQGTLAAEIEQHPTCARLTNGCEICRAEDVGKLACSMPGIACQPKAWQCDGLMVPREMEPGR